MLLIIKQLSHHYLFISLFVAPNGGLSDLLGGLFPDDFSKHFLSFKHWVVELKRGSCD